MCLYNADNSFGGKMKKLFTILALFYLGSSLVSCSEGTSANNNSEEKGTPVKTMVLELQPFNEYLKITGTVKARNQIDIIAEEGGVLAKILKDKGSYAQKGDTLAILENQVIHAQFKEAKAALHQVELDLKSSKTLYEKKAISENDYLISKFSWERANAAAELSGARYGKLFLTAKIPGYVNERYADQGAYLTPMSPAFEMVDNVVLKINAGIAERFLPDIKIGNPVELTFDAFPEIKIDSKVSFVSRSIDSRSRTFQVEIFLPNPNGKLAPQMVVNIKILRRAFDDQIVIPADAFLESEDGRYVFIDEDNYAKKIAIEIQAVYEGKIMVEGLSASQQLVVVGQQELTDGDLLNIITE